MIDAPSVGSAVVEATGARNSCDGDGFETAPLSRDHIGSYPPRHLDLLYHPAFLVNIVKVALSLQSAHHLSFKYNYIHNSSSGHLSYHLHPHNRILSQIFSFIFLEIKKE